MCSPECHKKRRRIQANELIIRQGKRLAKGMYLDVLLIKIMRNAQYNIIVKRGSPKANTKPGRR